MLTYNQERTLRTFTETRKIISYKFEYNLIAGQLECLELSLAWSVSHKYYTSLATGPLEADSLIFHRPILY